MIIVSIRKKRGGYGFLFHILTLPIFSGMFKGVYLVPGLKTPDGSRIYFYKKPKKNICTQLCSYLLHFIKKLCYTVKNRIGKTMTKSSTYCLISERRWLVRIFMTALWKALSSCGLKKIILSRCQRFSSVIGKRHTVLVTRAVKCRRFLLKLGGTTDCNDSP